MKKLVSTVLAAVLAASLATPALAALNSEFSDVPKSAWCYDAVMEMTRVGLFNGKTYLTDEALPTFDPRGTMTRAELLKVLVVYVYGSGIPGEWDPYWYSTYEARARRDGLLSEGDFADTLNTPCTREEMAYMLVNAVKLMGEDVGAVDEDYIPDYGSISPAYREAVRQAVYLGLITGTDDAHTFSPKATMTREQAVTVVHRLVDPTVRTTGLSRYRPGVREDATALTAGTYISDEALEDYTHKRPTLDKSDSLNDAIDKLNGFVFAVHMRRYLQHGIGLNHNAGQNTAMIVKDGDRWGMRVFGWRHSYDTDTAVNSVLNVALEGMRYLCGDKEVASALWKVVDYAAIHGNNGEISNEQVEAFGFTLSNETETSIDLHMNGQTIHWTWGTGDGNYFYFE